METWHPDDKAWLKARKAIWKPIKENLEDSGLFKNKRIKFLRRYFMTGQEIDAWEDDVDDLLLLEKLWFHPDQSDENWQRLLAETPKGNFLKSRDIFIQETRDGLGWTNEYGFMNGLEPRLLIFFCGDKFTTEEIDYGDGYKVSRFFLGPIPFFKQFVNNMRVWVDTTHFNPYCIFQYMVEHWFDCMPLLEETVFEDHRVEGLLQHIHHYKKTGETGANKQRQRDFAAKMLKELQERPLREELKVIWESVQKENP